MFYAYLALFLISFAFMILVAFRIKEKYEEDDSMLVELRQFLQDVFPEINNVILLKGTKSYTINKKRIYMCLKDEQGKYYERNMLVYVLLHELAHVKCKEIGHTDEFHRVFNQILEKAVHTGKYDPTIPIIKDYCEYNS